MVVLVPMLALAGLVAATPINRSAGPGSFTLVGRQKAGQTFRHANGTANLAIVNKEATFIRNKYEGHIKTLKKVKNGVLAAAKLVERATTTVALTDELYYGQDIEYYGPLNLGTPSQVLPLNFDTGSADLWVPTIAIAGSSGYFNQAKSSTVKTSTTPFSIQYGSGSCSGTLSSDTVTLGSLVVKSQFFGAVTTESADFYGDPAAGILGLGFQSIATSGKQTVIGNLIAAGALTANLFAFHYTRGVATGSELSVGAVNPKHFTGTIAYTPVTSQTYWEVNTQSMLVNNAPAASAFPAAIDTGTTYIYVPNSIAAAFYAAFPGASYDAADSGGGVNYYQFPCTATTVPGFVFGNNANKYNININDFNLGYTAADQTQCVGAVIGMDIKDFNGKLFGIIGDTFIKSWYSVFNYNVGGAPAVGFAPNV